MFSIRIGVSQCSALLASFCLLFSFPLFAIDLTGAGGTFSAPIYARWAADYQKATGNKVNYQGIGSSGGVKQIIAETVDFGASDTALSEEQLKENGLFQFPTVIGGVALVVNIPGVKPGQLTLDAQTISGIYLGKIKKWDDPEIAKLNSNIRLPNIDIAVVRRADGSSTSFIFTHYLSKISEEWKNKVGSGNTVNWPITGIAGKGNDGVAVFVQRLPGAIGYVEYSYAKQSGLAYTKMVNASGNVVSPSVTTFSKAAEYMQWNETASDADLTNLKGNETWPIVSTTYILLRKKTSNTEKNAQIINFFNWAYKQGKEAANSLDYVMLPESVMEQVRIAWKAKIIKNKDIASLPLSE